MIRPSLRGLVIYLAYASAPLKRRATLMRASGALFIGP